MSWIRRTQPERSAETRRVLVDAAIRLLSCHGYSRTTTAMIADAAGLSRGSILHHFGTRAALMAEVIQEVYRSEAEQYQAIVAAGKVGQRIEDWPVILWDVLSQPSGVAVLEIIQATQNDSELAVDVRTMQASIEAAALVDMRAGLGGTEEEALALMRLMVWAARGLSIANRLMPNQAATQSAVNLLSQLLKMAFPTGMIDTVEHR